MSLDRIAEELGGDYDKFKQFKKDKRKSNTEWSTKYLIDNKIEFQSKNGGSHLVLKDYDFYPSTGLFIHKTTKEKFRGIKNLIKRLKKI